MNFDERLAIELGRKIMDNLRSIQDVKERSLVLETIWTALEKLQGTVDDANLVHVLKVLGEAIYRLGHQGEVEDKTRRGIKRIEFGRMIEGSEKKPCLRYNGRKIWTADAPNTYHEWKDSPEIFIDDLGLLDSNCACRVEFDDFSMWGRADMAI